MRSLDREIFVCVDCETTGLDTQEDRIVEVGAIRFTLDGKIARYETLIDPQRPISKTSTEIHHITDEMVKGKPKIEEVLPKIFEFLREEVTIGHNISFDLDILTAEAKRAEIPYDFSKRMTIDTLRLARLYGESPTNSLKGLRRHFNIPPESAHRALDDALINIEVFKHLVRRFKTLEEVEKKLSRPIAMKTMPLGRHKGRPFSEVPIEYLKWAAGKDFDQDLLFSIRSEIKRRKKAPSFSPFQNL